MTEIELELAEADAEADELGDLERERDALREALAELVEWAARMGGFEAPCWDRAQALLCRDREP